MNNLIPNYLLKRNCKSQNKIEEMKIFKSKKLSIDTFLILNIKKKTCQKKVRKTAQYAEKNQTLKYNDKIQILAYRWVTWLTS